MEHSFGGFLKLQDYISVTVVCFTYKFVVMDYVRGNLDQLVYNNLCTENVINFKL